MEKIRRCDMDNEKEILTKVTYMDEREKSDIMAEKLTKLEYKMKEIEKSLLNYVIR